MSLVEQYIILRVGLRGALNFGVGYAYGALLDTDKMLTAKAAAISSVVYSVFTHLNRMITGGSEGDSPKAYWICQALITSLHATAEIVAFRRLNFIATNGTVVLGLIGLVFTIICIGNSVQEL